MSAANEGNEVATGGRRESNVEGAVNTMEVVE